MEQALKDSVRTVTPGSRSLGPNALASPGLLGSADSGGLHGACTQRQCQNPQGLYPKPKLPANTGARGRGHGRSRTQRPDVCPLCQRCQCSRRPRTRRAARIWAHSPTCALASPRLQMRVARRRRVASKVVRHAVYVPHVYGAGSRSIGEQLVTWPAACLCICTSPRHARL